MFVRVLYGDVDTTICWNWDFSCQRAFRYAAAARLWLPITSPILFISGPGAGSRPRNLMKGKTGALTQTASVCGSGKSRSANFSPIVSRAAIRAKGTPVALATKGMFSSLEDLLPKHTRFLHE